MDAKEIKRIRDIIELSILEVRANLAKEYNVTSVSENRNYTGLCDISITMLARQLKVRLAPLLKPNQRYEFHVIHGEQNHSIHLRSGAWIYEHTWGSVTVYTNDEEITFYVDPTMSQFDFLYHDEIPEYYVDIKSPKWYLPDKYNLNFVYPFSLLNRIPIPIYVNHQWHKIGFFEFMDYIVIGKCSDIIGKLIKK